MKILFTGISGFLGQHLRYLDLDSFEIHGIYHTHKPTLRGIHVHQLDLTDAAKTHKLIKELQVDVLIHLAALSNANQCEENPIENEKINFQLPLRLLELAQQQSIFFVFASTDLVFDGKKAPYKESSTPFPLMEYGKAKHQVEKYILKNHIDHTAIVRLPLLYGWCTQTANFFTHWLKNLYQQKTVYAFVDEYRTAAWAAEVLKGLLIIAERKEVGIFHLGGPKRQSRFDFFQEVAEHLSMNTGLVKESFQKEVKMAAARPSDVSLLSQRAISLGFQPQSLSEVMNLLENEIKFDLSQES